MINSSTVIIRSMPRHKSQFINEHYSFDTIATAETLKSQLVVSKHRKHVIQSYATHDRGNDISLKSWSIHSIVTSAMKWV